MVLAVLAVVGGFLGIPNGHDHWLHFFLKPSYVNGQAGTWIHDPGKIKADEIALMVVAVILALVSIGLAWYKFRKKGDLPAAHEEDMPKPVRVVYHKYYVDEFYDKVIRKPLDKLSDLTYRLFEIRVVDAFVNGIGGMTRWAGNTIRYIQTGTLGFYVFAMSLAVILILIFKVL